jgi:hypothetical protein
MPLYSNTTTGNNQITHTASEQVTKILSFDPPHLKTGNNYISYKELAIPLGPHQRVVGKLECWFDSNDTNELYGRLRFATPGSAYEIDGDDTAVTAVSKDGETYYNVSAATKVIGANNNTLAPGGSYDATGFNQLLNATFYDTSATVGTKWFGLNTSNTFARYFTISFKAVSTDNTNSELRWEFKAGGGGTPTDCHLEHGTRITYTKY